MSPDARYVFDTNVLVSALLLKDSTPGRALVAALDRGALLISPHTLEELRAVLGRPTFDRYLSHDDWYLSPN